VSSPLATARMPKKRSRYGNETYTFSPGCGFALRRLDFGQNSMSKIATVPRDERIQRLNSVARWAKRQPVDGPDPDEAQYAEET